MHRRYITRHGAYGSLHGELAVPDQPRGLVMIPHPHRIAVSDPAAQQLLDCGYAVFGTMLLSEREMQFPDATQDVARLTRRLLDIIELSNHDEDMLALPLALLVSGDVTPAAIRAAAQRDTRVLVIAALGGNADRAGLQALGMLNAPLLMLLDPSTGPSPDSWERVRARIDALTESQTLETGENPGPRIANWLSRHLPKPEST
jgi:hypothetical protein